MEEAPSYLKALQANALSSAKSIGHTHVDVKHIFTADCWVKRKAATVKEVHRSERRDDSWSDVVIEIITSMGDSSDQCFICSSVASDQCEVCQCQYCGHHHQYHHHPVTGQCLPYHVSRMEGVGRMILAARDIEPGEEIFREKELVVGPSRRVPPVCLG